MVVVPRGVGIWGDMVVTLRNGEKAELRALDRFRELKDYILQRRDELIAAEGGASKGSSPSSPASKPASNKGFAA